ncbi:hypothetical protein YC2023_019388 [Brassica napus]
MELDEGEAEAAMAHAKRLIQSGGQRGDAKGHGGVHGGWFPRLRERGSIVLSSSKKGGLGFKRPKANECAVNCVRRHWCVV